MSDPERRPDDVSSAPRPPVLLAVACGLVAFALYAWTTSPFVLNEDIAEFQALSATHGISHAGYPGYLLLLELAHNLPVSTVAYRANLVSAFAAAIAVAMAALASFRLTRNRLAAVASAAALTLSYSLWSDATRAEVYAYTLAMSTCAFLAALWYRDTSRTRALVSCMTLTGCALAGHLSSLALAAVVTWTVVRQVWRGRAPRAHLAIALGGLVLGLLPLALIPLRDTPGNAMNYIAYNFDQYSVRNIEWAPDLVTRLRRAALLLSGAQYLEGGWFHPFRDTFERLRFLLWHLLFNDLYLPGTLLALAGLAASLQRRSPMSRLLMAWLGIVLLLVMAAAFPMVLTSFFLPGLWVLCVCLGAGFARFAARSRSVEAAMLVLIVAHPFIRWQMRTPPALVARPSVAAAWAAWPEAWDPFRHDASWEEFARNVLATLPPRAELIVCWEEGTPLRYLQLAKGVRTDVTIHWSCDSPPRIEKILGDAAERRTQVLSTIPIARLPQPTSWVAAGRWERGQLARYAGPPPIWRRLLPN